MVDDLDAFADVVVRAIKRALDPISARVAELEAVSVVAASFAALAVRLKALEDRAPVVGPPGPAGERGADGVAGVKGDTGEVGTVGAVGPPGTPGEPGKDGQSIVGEPGRDGKDADPERVASMVEASVRALDLTAIVAADVARAVSTIERPKDGKDGRDGIDGKDGQAIVGPAGMDGAKGADGLSVVGPAGQDGAPGRDGRDGLSVPGPQGTKGLDGANGRDGVDGKDGLGFDDMTGEPDGERGFKIRFSRGDQVKEFSVKIANAMIYRGVFAAGQTYDAGDVTTWGGSMWCAKETTSAKPGESGVDSRSWVMCVKSGREGKQGIDGKIGPAGPRGEKGETIAKW